ncbi:ABC transporter substrate-binding protein [Cohnella hongkongensis]|uniref:ABC transporter substrate-binding protein n=1 Tax=Cohnella hongkongensis TaxID=178337 RepID=A0ABV9FI07_9BACL
MNKKRWIAAATVSSLLVLSACGTASTTEKDDAGKPPASAKATEKIELRFASWNTDDTSIGIMNKAKKLFEEAHPNVTVKIETVPSDNYMTKLQTEIAAGSPPDLMQIGERDMKRYMDKGIVIDLKPYAKGENPFNLDDIHHNVLNVIESDGKLPVIVKDAANFGIYYNKKLFDQAEVAYPTDDWTWEEFREIAKKLTIVENGKTVQYGAKLSFVKDTVELFAVGNGGGYLSADGKTTKGFLDDAKTAEGIQFLVDMFRQDKIAPNPADMAALKGINLMATGKVAMSFDGVWAGDALRKNPDLEIGVVGLPRFQNGKHVNLLYSSGWGISSKSKHPDEAWDFLRLLTSPDTEPGKEWAKTGLAVTKTLAQSSQQDQDPFLHVFLKELDYSINSGYFNNPYWGSVGDKIMNPAIEQMIINGDDVQKTLADLTSKLDQELARAAQ